MKNNIKWNIDAFFMRKELKKRQIHSKLFINHALKFSTFAALLHFKRKNHKKKLKEPCCVFKTEHRELKRREKEKEFQLSTFSQ